ncbi:hypothetical protein M5K25_008215 [Dendrobium thyrsiflorum]|uniref:Uncharacterized protein n=1 Tax=Dendrobium thyrsiflorum TaxID=117978 RepID=A0ABD0V891_DENTH
MAAKKVDALEERLEGEMNQIKTTVEERMSSMEGQVADLRDMIKKMLEVHNQTTASVARNGEGRSTNSEIPDDVVLYKHGEKSAEVLRSSAFRNVTFKSYNGLGHYTVPEEMDDVCKWLTARLGLDGTR